ncbi:MAG: hypothetical protein Q7T00_04655 [Rugosibacter sp.]|nr:hypothetical protein [Rugosibacter sp.]MDO9272241.1 hypothetical protein [Rugosibacter sp.]
MSPLLPFSSSLFYQRTTYTCISLFTLIGRGGALISMKKLIAFSFILLVVVAESSAHGTISVINSSQMQIFFAFIGVLTCLLGSLWLLTKLTLQRKASKTGLRIVIATPLGYQKQVVIIEIGNHATQKKEHPI